MKDTEIRIGNVYDIKVGRHTTAVRIMRLAEKEGWEAVSLASGNPVVIRSAQRIVGPHNPKPHRKKKEEQAPTDNTPPARGRKLSGLDAAAQVLAEAKTPMNCIDMVKAIFDKGLWKSDGNTPAATIYSAIIREIKAKGKDSRFRKTNKGLFEIA
ncbi:winged helix-turn-helix domain-containing protein [Anaerohalosphaeraceae bacterium U12dextr]